VKGQWGKGTARREPRVGWGGEEKAGLPPRRKDLKRQVPGGNFQKKKKEGLETFSQDNVGAR